MCSPPKAIKWFTILSIAFGSLSMAAFQIDFWPFSSYPMFNFRFDQEDPSVFVLIGVNHDSGLKIELSGQTILGPVRKGYLNRYCRKKIQEKKTDCLKTSLEYWGRRYKKYELQLPLAYRGLDSIYLIEKKSNKELGHVDLREWLGP
jgi:hypothetical protein